MNSSLVILTTVLVAALLASGVTWWAMRLRTERDLAVLETERDLLRERIVDLEAAVSEDAQTAGLLAPLRETMTRVERQVGVLERDRAGQYADVAAVMREVHASSGAVERATSTLAASLQSSSVRGAWGEVQLRRVLEVAGLLPRCDFDTQVSIRGADGQQLRPDAVVQLPGDKVLVIDAKAPMTAFLRAQGDDLDPAERERLFGEHAQALAGHIKLLSAKEYWSAFDTTPEMVVCFVPSEAMLGRALAADPTLHETAMRSKVVLASPASLFALVRTVAFTWQQDALTQNARELLALGQELYGRLSTLGTNVAAVGASLSRSMDAYNRMVGTLESRVLVTARKFRDLDLVSGDLDVVAPLEATPRPLTALELLDAVASAENHRPDLVFEVEPGADPRPAAADDPSARHAG